MEEIYPDEYYEFFIKFNEGDYYTCHDLIEDIWMEDKGNLFLKGLLQMSVALYHYSYGNVLGARVMMEVGREYLSNYLPFHWGLNVSRIIDFIMKCELLIPKDIDRIRYEEIEALPKLPNFYLYLESQ